MNGELQRGEKSLMERGESGGIDCSGRGKRRRSPVEGGGRRKCSGRRWLPDRRKTKPKPSPCPSAYSRPVE